MTYDGAKQIPVTINLSLSVTSGTNNIVLDIYIAKNGSVITDSKVSRKIGTGADVGNAGTHWTGDINANDYFECFVDVSTGTVNITAEQMVLIATEVG